MQIVSIDRIVYALCLIAPWSLLWLDSSLLFPYTTGKAWVFRSIVELSFALSLVLSGARPRSDCSQNKPGYARRVLVVALFGFLAWTALCNAFGIDVSRSFWSNWERMGGFIDYVHWAMYLFSLLIVINRGRIRGMLINLTLVITLVSLISLLDVEERSISTLGNPIYVGNLAVFGLFITAYLLAGCKPEKTWKLVLLRSTLVIALVVMTAAIFESASRGPMFALFVGFTVMVLSMGFSYARRHSRLAVAVLVTGVVVLGSLLVSQTNTIQQVFEKSDYYALQRLGRVSLANQTTVDRLENWRIALDAGQSRPWMGWGQENYMIAFNQYYQSGVIDRSQLWFDRAHNAYLDVLVASGVPGLLLYFMILGLPMWLLWRTPGCSRLEKSTILGLFTAFILKNLVGFDTFSSTLVWISLIAMILGMQKQAVLVNTRPPASIHFSVKLASLALLAISLLAVYALNIRPYQDNQRFAKLMNNPLALSSRQLEEILSQPPSSLRYAPNAKLAVFDKLLTKAANSTLDALEQKRMEQIFQRAGQLVNEALREQPENYRIKYNGALLLARFGQYDQAIRLLEELTQASPNRTAFWYALEQIYVAQGRDESALMARETAIKLNPNWKP